MCSLTDHVAEGILKYSLIPYAKLHNIEIDDLIGELVQYHNKTTSKKNINIESSPTEPIHVKRGRGRPKGSGKKKHVVLNFND